ncbi:MAG: M28 family peptidase [Saprospiraceae bacterium]|nr:M28 family peptidase [Saprospiraceae bacterium]
MYKLFFILTFFSLINIGCKNDKSSATELNEKPISATPKKRRWYLRSMQIQHMHLSKNNYLFGTRVPGSPGHKAMKEWLVTKTKSYGLEVMVQEFTTSFMNKTNVKAYNIIASLNPEKSERILLAAHWDTRLIAEKDPDAKKVNTPIMGADDGGSGVAALLEIMRVMSEKQIDLGVDFIFFDAEDQGNEGVDWCLGSILVKNLHQKDYKVDWEFCWTLLVQKGPCFTKKNFPDIMQKHILTKYGPLLKKWAMGNILSTSLSELFRMITIL